VLHLARDRDGAVCPHEPSQHRVEISSPILKGLAPTPESTGKLGVAEPVDSWVTQARDAQRLGRVRALWPASELPKQQEFRKLGRVSEEFFVARHPNALDPLGNLDPAGQAVHQFGPLVCGRRLVAVYECLRWGLDEAGPAADTMRAALSVAL
jgi:hypothetical protein